MKYLVYLILICGFGCKAIAMSNACKCTDTEINAPVSATPTPTTVKPEALPPLSWEKNHPERIAWSDFTLNLVGGELFATFDKAQDAKRICPKYASLNKEQKAVVWAELFSAVSFFESGWKLNSWMTESGLGVDAITKKQVKSEGLLQLSYQDTQWAKYCAFDWSKDKLLDQNDLKKTIFDPYKNLNCGIRILATQVKNKGTVIMSSNVYWSVLKDGGKYSKVDQIIAMVQKTGLCK